MENDIPLHNLEKHKRPECPICFEKISKCENYAIINNPGENEKFHIDCLEKWLKQHNGGISTRTNITSYTEYQDNKPTNTITLNEEDYINLEMDALNNRLHGYIEDSDDELINVDTDDFCPWLKYIIIFCVIYIILVIVLTFILIFIKKNKYIN